MAKWIKVLIISILVLSTLIVPYILFTPNHIAREMTAITYTGDVYHVKLNLTVRRTRSLEQRVHGYILLGGIKHVSAWDIDFFVRTWGGDRNSRNIIGFDTFFPYYLEINTVDDFSLATRNQTRVYSDSIRFETVMLLLFSEPKKIFCTETNEYSFNAATAYYAPAETLEDIYYIQYVVGWR